MIRVAAVLFCLVAAAPLDPVRSRDLLVRILSEDEASRATARVAISRSRDRSLVPALVDALFFASPVARLDVVACLEALTGEQLGGTYRYWVEYIGGRPEMRPKDGYRAWKAALFSRIDPAFGRFLDPRSPITIRPEEIVWGGVRKDGIPALSDPKTMPATDARFLDDAEIVFGVAVAAETRAYPQRILDWHEMANDTLGGVPFALSYCTLCGSAIAFGTATPDGGAHRFGSSGLLYRSNKLMYDEATHSLWSNLTGEPVTGTLVGRGIRLPILPLTVTTWKEWRNRHPRSSVVDVDTGHRRDYSPGAAYGKYFASPETMFPVWKRSPLLAGKSWIFGVRSGASARAYPIDVLLRERVVNDLVGDVAVVLVADPTSGAVRAYRRGDRAFAEGPTHGEIVEPATGALWRVEEEALRPASSERSVLSRFPGHRAYWFGWFAFFPDTTLYEGCTPLPAGGR